MLKAAVDVHYRSAVAKAVCLLFEEWQATSVFSTHVAFVNDVAPYEPGAFYKRELPCILQVLQQVNLSLVDTLVVDGYVYVDDEEAKGLGAHLFDALQQQLPVIGVAKTRFHGNRKNVVEVFRGKSRNPLYVTAIGLPLTTAAAAIQSMYGEHRMPDLLQALDRKTKMTDE
jgi:deoxyinosine 3'endonuclease (endonuclease V)